MATQIVKINLNKCRKWLATMQFQINPEVPAPLPLKYRPPYHLFDFMYVKQRSVDAKQELSDKWCGEVPAP